MSMIWSLFLSILVVIFTPLGVFGRRHLVLPGFRLGSPLWTLPHCNYFLTDCFLYLLVPFPFVGREKNGQTGVEPRYPDMM